MSFPVLVRAQPDSDEWWTRPPPRIHATNVREAIPKKEKKKKTEKKTGVCIEERKAQQKA